MNTQKNTSHTSALENTMDPMVYKQSPVTYHEATLIRDFVTPEARDIYNICVRLVEEKLEAAGGVDWLDAYSDKGSEKNKELARLTVQRALDAAKWAKGIM